MPPSYGRRFARPFFTGREHEHEDGQKSHSREHSLTLDAAARAWLSEWPVPVTDAVERRARVTSIKTELVLRSDFEGPNTLVRLTQLETRRCAFFRCTFEVTAANFVLGVDSAAEASPVLRSFIDEITVGI